MIEKFKKVPHTATREDVRWFWQDMDMDDPGNYALAKAAVAEDKRFLRWNEQYPHELTEWLREWYTYMPDALSLHLDGAGQIDWNLLFTLIEPINTAGIPFICLRKALNVRQNQIVREQIYTEITNDPILRGKILNCKPIPAIYTHYTPYFTIQKEVLRRIKPEVLTAPAGSRRTFLLAEKLMRKGLQLTIALKEAQE